MSSELIIEWPQPEICVLRMNRPEAYNALSRKLLSELEAAVTSISATRARVLILAATSPGFCAGADLKERKSLNDEEKYLHNRQINAVANALAAAPVCTIAAINGVAMGGGLELSLACDLRFATQGSKIGLTEARVGAIPGAGGSQRLPRLIGAAKALEMMYTGEPVDGARAEALGIVNAVTSDEGLMDRVMSFATIVASRSRSATAKLKEVVYRGLETDLEGGLELERVAIVDILKSADYQEGLAAFAERRKPNFG